MNDFLSAGSWLPYVALFLPLLIGLLVKSSASEKVKSVTMIVVTGVASLAYKVDAGGGILTKEMAGAWAMSMIIAVSSYYGVWRPLGAGNLGGDKVGIG
jgi:hypothetical protein